MAIPLIDNIRVNSPKAAEDRSGKFVSGQWQPYASVTEANSLIDINIRHKGLTVFVLFNNVLTEFWYRDGIADNNLIQKTGNTSLTVDQSIVGNSTNPVAGGAVSTALSGKVDKDGTKVLTDVNFTTALSAKLSGIQAGATLNATNAELRDRSTHTGAQPASTISDFTTAARAAFSAGANVTITNGVIAALGTAINRETYTTGASVTLANTTNWLIVNPSSVVNGLAINLPATPTDRQLLRISFGGVIAGGASVATSLSLNAGTGKAIVSFSTPTEVVSGETITLLYNSENSRWYRI